MAWQKAKPQKKAISAKDGGRLSRIFGDEQDLTGRRPGVGIHDSSRSGSNISPTTNWKRSAPSVSFARISAARNFCDEKKCVRGTNAFPAH
jgi:hypothetical protein